MDFVVFLYGITYLYGIAMEIGIFPYAIPYKGFYELGHN